MTIHATEAGTSAMFRALVERASDLAMLAAADGTILYASPVVERLFGYTRDQVQELVGFQFIHPDDRAARQASWERLVASPPGTVEVSRFRVRDVAGRYRHVEQRATNLLDDPALRGVAVSLQDVTDRVVADEALARSRHDLEQLTASQQRLLDRYRIAVEASRLGVWEYAPEREELVWTADPDLAERAATGGLEPGAHNIQDLWALIHPDDAEGWRRTVQRALEEGSAFSTEYRVRLPEGERVWQAFGRTVDHAGRRRVVGTVRDVTDLRREEDRLRREQDRIAQVERFVAMGELAAGLAHDVSNLLTVVHGHADLLAMELGEDHEDVRGILRAAEGGRGMLQRVLSFARPATGTGDVPAPAEAVRAFAGSLPQLLGPNVHVDLVLDESTPPVPMDVAQLEQVLLNLCVNAGAAMPKGGRLRISCVPLPEDRRATAPSSMTGQLVELVVADDGVGIDPEVLPRVFEPFVTTGRRDGGNGLGLAIVYRTVTEAGGHVEIDSAPGAGTRVRVLVPVVGGVAG